MPPFYTTYNKPLATEGYRLYTSGHKNHLKQTWTQFEEDQEPLDGTAAKAAALSAFKADTERMLSEI